MSSPGNTHHSTHWSHHLRDRLGEPLHLNLISLFVYLFGSYRMKVYFDLVIRRNAAFGLLHAADHAAALGIDKITALEFGVASGQGLINMGRIGEAVTQVTGVAIDVVGFDTGTGLPPPRDYRDHPEHYQTGDFPPIDRQKLQDLLPANTRLIYGEIADTVSDFISQLDNVVGYVAIDVDYYWSAADCLALFTDPEPTKYLPTTTVWVDDVVEESNNPWCGELLAINEFNAAHAMRKIAPFRLLRNERIFKRARWIDQIYTLHVLDHPRRSVNTVPARPTRVLNNPLIAE